jgi:hypothetical protein
MRVFNALALATLAGLLLTSPVSAQQAPAASGYPSAESPTGLDAALAAHELAVDQHRAHLADLLSLPEVRDLADARGIDMARVEGLAESLSDGEMLGLAPLVESATTAMRAQQLGTVTISVAAIIILLLILILVT